MQGYDLDLRQTELAEAAGSAYFDLIFFEVELSHYKSQVIHIQYLVAETQRHYQSA